MHQWHLCSPGPATGPPWALTCSQWTRHGPTVDWEWAHFLCKFRVQVLSVRDPVACRCRGLVACMCRVQARNLAGCNFPPVHGSVSHLCSTLSSWRPPGLEYTAATSQIGIGPQCVPCAPTSAQDDNSGTQSMLCCNDCCCNDSGLQLTQDGAALGDLNVQGALVRM